ncbi:outer membrane protein assembly factor BamE domain-containing protein [Metabacillus malikii]|uniref:Outer membrane protein assembly factor BamE (Lipoprotein component of BamABCDE complex) n=1 Tax=Metabacillus malikii TaxID=1504265 RepID=A0ABT9ZIF1_9BACI|nr:outer membrane protein assembly factor BamE [Metabacillus malikii]MDQ0232062.1 outer membrane protein assembly factor BamE (lipoprotein component of BamABCDE complex) [Metabacillus malikii]
MTTIQKLFEILLYFYCLGYVFVYIGFFLIIQVTHLDFNLVSTLAIILPFLILLVFVSGFWNATYHDVKKEFWMKQRLLFITILGSLPLIICSIFLAINEYQSIFQRERWVNNESDRVYMVDDLLSEVELTGKTREEVITLLGAPTETEYFQTDSNIVYYLGTERGIIPIDSEWLVIDFDHNDVVKGYTVQTD